MKSKEIKTANLRLSEIKAEDKSDLIKLIENEEICRTYMVPENPTDEQKDAIFGRYRALSASPDRFAYGIYRENRFIGLIHEVCRDDNGIELGYIIDPAEKNKGYATEALSAAITELLLRGFGAVVAGAFEENIASLRVMEKCGMSPTGETERIEYRGKTHNCIYMKIKNVK